MNLHPYRKRAGATLVEILVVAGIIAIAASIGVQTIAAARSKAYQAQCLSNIHQLILAVQMYQQDHNGKLPLKSTVFTEVQFPPGALKCPSQKDDSPIGYGYNAWISGRTLGSEGMPKASELPVIADSSAPDHMMFTPMDIAYRHIGSTANTVNTSGVSLSNQHNSSTANVVYADGHATSSLSTLITPITDHELLAEQVPSWPSGYKAISYPVPTSVDPSNYWNSLRVDVIPGWESNEFGENGVLTDLSNIGGPFGTGFCDDEALWLHGFPYYGGSMGLSNIKPYAEIYLDIPLPENDRSITDTGFWVVCLPIFDFVNMGASMDITTQYPPQMKGYAQVNVLDAAKKTIASFQLKLGGRSPTSAEYTINGSSLVALDDMAEPTNNVWEELPPPYGWNSIKAWNYKYANSKDWWELDWPHALTIIGKGDGSITGSIYAANTPVAGMTTAQTGDGNIKEPRWIELRCSDVCPGHPGEGSIRVTTQRYGGGILWGTTKE